MDDIKILKPGERLKELRKKLQLKQEELAGEKFSKNYISMFENNRRNINAINASYLANKINEFSEKKGMDIKINTSYLLKGQRDIAYDKCENWLREIETDLSLSNVEINFKAYKCLLLAAKYKLDALKGKALYLKGIDSFKNKRYDCAITQFLDSARYYSKERDFGFIVKIYEQVGICLYESGEFKQALIYFNLADTIIMSDYSNELSSENINYYKALCYYHLGEYNIAKRIINEDKIDDESTLKLEKIITERVVR